MSVKSAFAFFDDNFFKNLILENNKRQYVKKNKKSWRKLKKDVKLSENYCKILK